MIDRFGWQEIGVVVDVIKKGELSSFFKDFRGGEQIQAFEKEFAEYLGATSCISVANGTVSLEIALKAINIKDYEVITTPLSFIATGTAILAAGGNPVFIDIDPHTLNIDPAKIEENITEKTIAILPVSLLGYPAPMDKICKIAKKNLLYVVEDAAQALGSTINGKKIGTWGYAGSFSFQFTKQITTLGEGGAIVTNNPDLAEKCRKIRNHGNYYSDLDDSVSTNARLTEAAAAFGRMQLRKLDEFNKIQKENAEYFLDEAPLEKLGLELVYRDDPYFKSTFLLIPTYAKDEEIRNKLLGDLKMCGISQGVPGHNVGYYSKLIYQNPIFKDAKRDCPIAEEAIKRIVLWDVHRWREQKDMEALISFLNWMVKEK